MPLEERGFFESSSRPPSNAESSLNKYKVNIFKIQINLMDILGIVPSELLIPSYYVPKSFLGISTSLKEFIIIQSIFHGFFRIPNLFKRFFGILTIFKGYSINTRSLHKNKQKSHCQSEIFQINGYKCS